jgi:hypothetical protein
MVRGSLEIKASMPGKIIPRLGPEGKKQSGRPMAKNLRKGVDGVSHL